MNLVVHQVRELEHVDVANGNFLRENIARHSVVQRNFPGLRQLGEFQQVAYVVFASAVKHRRCEWHAFAEAMGQV